VGCAKGSMVFAFKELGVEAFGVDISAYAIHSAPKPLKPYLHVADLDEDSLPFEDGFFDFVTFLGSIEYLHDHRKAIANLKRVMADGASLLLTTIYKRPKNDAYRVNVHCRDFWIREFGQDWTEPSNYDDFMADYFHYSVSSKLISATIKKLLFGKSKFTDKLFCFMYNALAKFRVLSYGVVLLTLHKTA
jgi:SAM-dependent methyltransferase